MNIYRQNNIINQEEEIISSLNKLPIIIVIRPNYYNLLEPLYKENLFKLVDELYMQGIKHIELAWLNNPQWINLVEELLAEFRKLNLGIASISSIEGLNSIRKLGIKYAMSPVLDENLQKQAHKLNLVLIPGVFTPSEIQQAKNLNCKIIKLFPAKTLGIEYLNQIKLPLGTIPFTIAAGGLTVQDLNSWIAAGYNAIALGRNLIHQGNSKEELKHWLNSYSQSIKEP